MGHAFLFYSKCQSGFVPIDPITVMIEFNLAPPQEPQEKTTIRTLNHEGCGTQPS